MRFKYSPLAPIELGIHPYLTPQLINFLCLAMSSWLAEQKGIINNGRMYSSSKIIVILNEKMKQTRIKEIKRKAKKESAQ